MDTGISPLVLTKTSIPVRRAGVIVRTRLMDLGCADAAEAIVVLSAPAGYGKTTLLLEWIERLQQQGHAIAWYALDTADNNVIPFAAYLVASLSPALGESSEMLHLSQLLRSSSEVDLQHVIRSIINAVYINQQPCILFMDDYHLITSKEIHQAMEYLCDHLPHNMRLVISSRIAPPFSVARLRARGRLMEIGADDLRFSSDETSRFLNDFMKLELSTEEIATLESRTEGWVAGLQLAGLSISGRKDKEDLIASFTGSHHYLVEYLLEEVFNRQTEQVQAFLLQTSILDRFCPPLCDAMIDDNLSSDLILSQLDQDNLFLVSLDEQKQWFRYHHLFRDFLQARLQKQSPQEVMRLHRLASEWLNANGLYREAAQQAFQTRDWEYAAALVEQLGFLMIIHSEISILYEWTSNFPETLMQQHPMLAILQAWALVYRYRRQNLPRIKDRLAQVEQGILKIKNQAYAAELIEHLAVVRSFLAMVPDPGVNAKVHLAAAQKMLGPYPQGHPGQYSARLTAGYAYLALHQAHSAAETLENARQTAFKGDLFFGYVEATFHLARLAHTQGHLRQAADLCLQSKNKIEAILPQAEQALPALGCLDIAWGYVLLEQDQLKSAEQHLLDGLKLVGVGSNPYYLWTAYLALARCYLYQNDLQRSLHQLDQLEEIWPDIAFCTQGLRYRFILQSSEADPSVLQEASLWCQRVATLFDEANPVPGMGPLGAAEVYYQTQLSWLWIQIAIADGQQVRGKLHRLLAPALENELQDRMIELLIVQGLLEWKEGKAQEALQALEHALTLAQPQGYLRIFDQGPLLNHLLQEAARKGCYPAYIRKLLSSFEVQARIKIVKTTGQTSDELDAEMAGFENLTERELEVLGLIAQGATNLTIAKTLVITVGTVKSHINHILRKLDAQNRTEAVAKARMHGII